MKKVLCYSILMLSTLLVNSCSSGDLRDNSENEVVTKGRNLEHTSKTALSDEKYVLPVIFTDANGYNTNNSPCSSYKLYATSDVLSANDRVVHVIAISNNTIVDGKIFTIPAGQYVSQTINVFSNANRSYGNVEIKVNSVKENGVITDEYELKAIDTQVNNCYRNTPVLPGPLDPSECYEDLNNDGYPDCYEST
ncbi:hypothetical protein FY557_14310 [Chryseobacterium sp. SN22]|uniref:hypothetical protein n=1 Tax=Chryseobacterium sp. SN22 TaxID=2606431 RepID=UPI0011EE3042|nr:hypothetical protein [Chryseobacterium sp. SN22]KAA0127157.1 hypothetical protein FY557_14310 [Chryseobacterium sp. SN22]